MLPYQSIRFIRILQSMEVSTAASIKVMSIPVIRADCIFVWRGFSLMRSCFCFLFSGIAWLIGRIVDRDNVWHIMHTRWQQGRYADWHVGWRDHLQIERWRSPFNAFSAFLVHLQQVGHRFVRGASICCLAESKRCFDKRQSIGMMGLRKMIIT